MSGIDGAAPLVAPLVLADIDGTLVHSHRRCADVQGAIVVERYDGRAVGFMSPSAFAMLTDLQARSILVRRQPGPPASTPASSFRRSRRWRLWLLGG